jgi:sugar diacid utilization regulator
MASVWELLTREPGHPFVLLAGAPAAAREAVRLSAVDGLDELAGTVAGALILVPRYQLAHVASYELDVAVRVASDRGVAGLVLVGTAQLPVTVKQLADRAGLTIIGTSGTDTMVDLVRRLDHLMGQGQAAALERACSTAEWARGLDGHGDHLAVLREASARLGTELQLTWLERPDPAAEPVCVGGRQVGWVHSEAREDPAIMLTLPTAAAAIGRRYEQRINAEESTGELIASLIEAESSAARATTADRIVTAGVHLDADHVVICVASEQGAVSDGDLLTARHRRTVATIVLREQLGLSADSWLISRIEQDPALVWSYHQDDEPDMDAATATAERVLSALHRQYPMAQFFGGIGAAGPGVDGLLMSAATARSAARSAQSRGLPGRVVQGVGSRLEQVLADVATPSSSRRIIDGVLAPFDQLPEEWRSTMIETLSTYLEMQGSKVRAARLLHVHPNAVGYRVAKAVKMLDADISDPDTRFILQLACRVRLMSHNHMPEVP